MVVVSDAGDPRLVGMIDVLQVLARMLIRSISEEVNGASSAVRIIPRVIVLTCEQLGIIRRGILPNAAVRPIALTAEGRANVEERLLGNVCQTAVTSVRSVTSKEVGVDRYICVCRLENARDLLLEGLTS